MPPINPNFSIILIILPRSGLNVLALTMIFLWVPETKQRTLEELDYICKLSIT